MMVDISGLDKTLLLAVLWNNAKKQSAFDFSKSMPKQRAEELMAYAGDRPYFDWVDGRCLKIDLLGDAMDPRLYDRDNGEGAAARVVNLLRNNIGMTIQENASGKEVDKGAASPLHGNGEGQAQKEVLPQGVGGLKRDSGSGGGQ